MKLPLKGDPRRPLQLAVRSTCALAILFLFFGGVSVLFSLRAGIPIGLPAADVISQILELLACLAPGAGLLVLSFYLKRRKYWAVLTCLVVTSIFLFFTVLSGLGILLAALTDFVGNFRDAPESAILGFVSVVAIWSLVAFGLGRLLINLAKSFLAIKYLPMEQPIELSFGHGFEPQMPGGIPWQPMNTPPPMPPAAQPEQILDFRTPPSDFPSASALSTSSVQDAIPLNYMSSPVFGQNNWAVLALMPTTAAWHSAKRALEQVNITARMGGGSDLIRGEEDAGNSGIELLVEADDFPLAQKALTAHSRGRTICPHCSQPEGRENPVAWYWYFMAVIFLGLSPFWPAGYKCDHCGKTWG